MGLTAWLWSSNDSSSSNPITNSDASKAGSAAAHRNPDPATRKSILTL